MKKVEIILKLFIPGISFAFVLSGGLGLISVLDGYGDAGLLLRYCIVLLVIFCSAGLILLAYGKLFKIDLSLSNRFFLMFLLPACGAVMMALSHALKWAFRAKEYDFWDFPRILAFPIALFLFVVLSRTKRTAVKNITASATLILFGFWLLISLTGSISLVRGKNPDQIDGPNILLLSIESFRYDHLSMTSGGSIQTPFLDKFAKNSVFFDRYFVQAPYTTSSLTTILTGRYPFRHGARAFGQKPNPEERTFLEALEKKGLKVEVDAVFFNELFFSWRRFSSRKDRLRDYFLDKISSIQGNIINPVLGEMFPGLFGSYCFGFNTSLHQTAELMRRIRKNRNHKWFFWTHFNANCHWAYGAPPQFTKLYQSGIESSNLSVSRKEIQDWNAQSKKLGGEDLKRIDAAYSAEVSCIDRQIEMVIRQLERLGLLKNTVVFITSDHGELLGEEGFIGHGWNVKENLLHVPLMIYPGEPSDLTGGIRIGNTVESIDLAPTILELFGIPYEEVDFDGDSLLDLMRGKPRSERSAYGELSSLDGRRFTASLKKGEFRLIWNSRNNMFSLHKFQQDPEEKHNLIEQYPEIAEELKMEMLKLSGKEDLSELIPGKAENQDPKMKEKLRALGYIK